MRFYLAILLTLLAGGAFAADPVTGFARVLDGDTVEIGSHRIRLHGIDAPESGQSCHGTPCGTAARDALDRLIDGAAISCQALDRDAYDRIIARCRKAGKDLGARMVAAGWAAAFTRFSTEYVPEERLARQGARGMWASGTPQMPWEFRAARWDSSARSAPRAGCPIKGNISAQGRIYHPPWSRWYDRTRIDTSRGERWFCDEAEAQAAGWRPPRG